ncbi:DNA repair protein complementing XP-C cells homolog [Physella acuta]|uniref:DNA repair protein complementing XP-C cells homolog n=1 Tax=Physella acuta TaxID=109671 RepID=UPI0027DB9D89|nr:DNA repair protein complementing XP-C cells homolog [Physella acuta]
MKHESESIKRMQSRPEIVKKRKIPENTCPLPNKQAKGVKDGLNAKQLQTEAKSHPNVQTTTKSDLTKTDPQPSHSRKNSKRSLTSSDESSSQIKVKKCDSLNNQVKKKAGSQNSQVKKKDDSLNSQVKKKVKTLNSKVKKKATSTSSLSSKEPPHNKSEKINSKSKQENKTDKLNLSETNVGCDSKAVHKPTNCIKGKKNKTSLPTKVSPKKDEGRNKNQANDKNVTSYPAKTPVDMDDPLAILMMMEGQQSSHLSSQASSQLASTSSMTSTETSDGELNHTTDSESEGMSDWEEVHDHEMAPERSQIPDQPVEITLEMPDILKRKIRKKKAFDWKAYLQRRVKRFKKEVAIDMHKVHLLCLLSLGMQQNEALNEPVLIGVVFSLLPDHFIKTKVSLEQKVENIAAWYKKSYTLDKITHCSDIRLVSTTTLINILAHGTITDARVWVLVFICILRAMGHTVRLVLSLQPMPFKVPENSEEGSQSKKTKQPDKKKSSGSDKKKKTEALKQKKAPAKQAAASKETKAPAAQSTQHQRKSVRESSKKAALKNRKSLEDMEDDSDDDEDHSQSSSDNKFSNDDNKKRKKLTKKKEKCQKSHSNDESSSEKEFADTSFNIRSPKNLTKDLKILSNRKILSASTSGDDSDSHSSSDVGHDFWLEIYFPEKNKWMCFDLFKSQFGKPYSLENSATQPITYVLGFKNDGSVKDVTARYAKQWLSFTRKNRVDSEWWMQTLFIFDKASFKDNLIEDDEIKGQLLVRPMPTSIAEFKNHPLYALRRHLLKFEAIYPDTSIPVGYIKKEPVYARECVRTLHSRVNWLKEGRLVRLDEKPYKMVKSRPKWNKPKDNPDELDLELYGEWQTDKYIPPPAYNGKVPRNEYGNVELFKPWMLPSGTVQLRGQGLQRVAKKLGIDIAPAMIGWDYHRGMPHAMMDGWVVCEEFADTLMTAWLEDQEIQQQREQEKKDSRVYGNWRKLIRGLLIKERLHKKFLQEPTLVQEVCEEKETFSDGEVAVDVQHSWPRNRQEQTTKGDKPRQQKQEKLIEEVIKPEGSEVKALEQTPAGDNKQKGLKKSGKDFMVDVKDEDAFENLNDQVKVPPKGKGGQNTRQSKRFANTDDVGTEKTEELQPARQTRGRKAKKTEDKNTEQEEQEVDQKTKKEKQNRVVKKSGNKNCDEAGEITDDEMEKATGRKKKIVANNSSASRRRKN